MTDSTPTKRSETDTAFPKKVAFVIGSMNQNECGIPFCAVRIEITETKTERRRMDQEDQHEANRISKS